MGAHGRVEHRYQRGNVSTNTRDQLQMRPSAGNEGGREGRARESVWEGEPPCSHPTAARHPCQGGLAQPESWPHPRSTPASHVGWLEALRDMASLLWPWFHRPGLGDIP